MIYHLYVGNGLVFQLVGYKLYTWISILGINEKTEIEQFEM